ALHDCTSGPRCTRRVHVRADTQSTSARPGGYALHDCRSLPGDAADDQGRVKPVASRWSIRFCCGNIEPNKFKESRRKG
ncbi:MAG: hypothetical protein Q8P50_13510, partial [Bacillota bacterium]|nr:hypothetical protein [Bacillota bacterium]